MSGYSSVSFFITLGNQLAGILIQHFLDKMNDNDMLILADYGLEGITYDLNEDGNIVGYSRKLIVVIEDILEAEYNLRTFSVYHRYVFTCLSFAMLRRSA
ncbi:MAG: hypothetical protein WCD89_03020 [Anaerocolumna sp.]